MADQSVKKTALYDKHVEAGAKMVAFGGYLMPVQYRGIIEEHKKVRNAAGIFDVSHMGEFEVHGGGAVDFLQRVTINDVAKLEVGQAQYSAMCYPDGGIVDDLIIYRFPNFYMMIVNAANIDKDYQWLEQNRLEAVELKNVSEQNALIAVQGRFAQQVLQQLTGHDLDQIKYYHFATPRLLDTQAMISRTGYTGEDGFEVMLSAQKAPQLWDALLDAGQEFDLEPIGLGARDTLRLEVKYSLYGNDIDQTTNPIEAGLGWITKLDKGDFIGKEAIAKVKAEGPERKLVGFEVDGRQIARHGYKIVKEGREIGVVTSGTMSPSLNKSIGLGYVEAGHSKVGSVLGIEVRGREIPATVVKPPFYKRPY